MAEKDYRWFFEGLDGEVRITLPLFPNTDSGCPLSDLARFASSGNSIYGYDEHLVNPFVTAPRDESAGGVLFFGNDIAKNDFLALTRVLEINNKKDYAAFLGESVIPKEDGYLRQLRLVSAFALRFHYGVLTSQELNQFPAQDLTMSEAFWRFIEHEKMDWGTFFGSPKLEGKFGGDGDFAREELSFGIMVENSYEQIYRIWSRAWLVTK